MQAIDNPFRVPSVRVFPFGPYKEMLGLCELGWYLR
jgi:hypothetical protein